MALFDDIDTAGAAAKAADFWRVPIGAASPLWFAYSGAASVGIVYWWMSQWIKPVNLEAYGMTMPAVMDALPAPAVVEQTLAALLPEPVALDPVIEPAAPEEIVAEATAEAVKEAVDAADEVAVIISLAADDLTRLVGIGPTLASKLSELGVRTFADIAAWSEEDLELFDHALDLKGRAVREAWIDQARQFAAQ